MTNVNPKPDRHSYRLGVFGFANILNMPEVNFGLRDQRLVVEWVRGKSHISRPTEIVSLKAPPRQHSRLRRRPSAHHLIWPLRGQHKRRQARLRLAARPHRARHHPAVRHRGRPRGQGYATSWMNGASLLRCGDANRNADAMLACARGKSAEEVADAFSRFELGPLTDNKTAYRSYVAPLEQGRFARVPALIGHTAAEWDTYDRRSIFPDSAPGARKVDETPLRKAVESFLVCRAGRTAKARAALGLPTWLYVYAGDFPNQRTAPELKTEPWHGSEVGLVFGTELRWSERRQTRRSRRSLGRRCGRRGRLLRKTRRLASTS